MRIAHMDFTGNYNDDSGYQMNHLSRQNVADGKETFIATTDYYFENGKTLSLDLRAELSYVNDYGVHVTRFPYCRIISRFVSKKIRKINGCYAYLEKVKPDVIFFHGIGTWELLTVARYKTNHPTLRLYADNHAHFTNSATNFLSKSVLHRIFYRLIIKKAYPIIDKIFYISMDAKDVLNQLYGLPDDKLEFYPLGGVIFEEEKRSFLRQKVRNALGLSSENLLFVHSGKLEKPKRTEELLKAFSLVKTTSFKLLIIGSIPDERKQLLLPLIEADNRIQFLGWKNSDELLEYLCACDLYLQPGQQSATMQNAMCCKAPIMLFPHKSHEPYLKGNGWFVKTEEDIEQVFLTISKNPDILKQMSERSYEIARNILDYKKLAAKIYR